MSLQDIRQSKGVSRMSDPKMIKAPVERVSGCARQGGGVPRAGQNFLNFDFEGSGNL